MIQVTRAAVIERVRKLADELLPFDADKVQQASVKDVPKEYIDAALDEATDAAMLVCSPKAIVKTAFGTGSVSTATEGEVTYNKVVVPADCLRIVDIKMKKWQRAVTELTDINSEKYRQLRNPYSQAGVTKPAAVWRTALYATSGNSDLEAYGSRSEDAIDTGWYIKRIRFGTMLKDDDGNLYEQGVSIDYRLLAAICWRCAGEVLAIMGRSEAYKAAQAFYDEALKVTFL